MLKLLVIFTLCCPALVGAAPRHYPITSRDVVTNDFFGTTVSDPYRWLEDRTRPETAVWISSQAALARAVLDALPEREVIRSHLQAYLHLPYHSLPVLVGERTLFAQSNVAAPDLQLFWREKGRNLPKLLIDPQTMNISNASLGSWYPSPDGRWLAFALQLHHSDEGVLMTCEIAHCSATLSAPIPWANFADVAWRPDSNSFYYLALSTTQVTGPEAVANAAIRLHEMKTAWGPDSEIYPATHNPSLYLSPSVSKEGTLFIAVDNGWTSNEIFRQHAPGEEFQKVFSSTTAFSTAYSINGKTFLWTTSGAPNGRIVALDKTSSQQRVVVPERRRVVIRAVESVGALFVITASANAESWVELWNTSGKKLRKINFAVAGSISDVAESQGKIFFRYESFALPPQIYFFQLPAGAVHLWESNTSQSQPAIKIRRVSYPSSDGTEIPMNIVEAVESSATFHPVLIQAYGGFAEAQEPRFSALALTWIQAGGVFAVPHLRGGGEYGESWHQAGIGAAKQHTVDDIAAAAQFFAQSQAHPPVVLQGASNGGLMVAAAIMQHPGLFAGATCKAPLTDMVRYEQFGQGPAWVSEYGSVKNREEFVGLYAYSPYHHVTAQRYPPMLFLSGEHDDRVDPMHARKMVAALQEADSHGGPFLLRIEQEAGHGGGNNSARLEEYIDRVAFLRAAAQGQFFESLP